MDKDQLRDKLQDLKDEMTDQEVRYARKWFEEEEFRIFGRVGNSVGENKSD